MRKVLIKWNGLLRCARNDGNGGISGTDCFAALAMTVARM